MSRARTTTRRPHAIRSLLPIAILTVLELDGHVNICNSHHSNGDPSESADHRRQSRLVEHLALRPAGVGPTIAAVMLVFISLAARAASASAKTPPSAEPVTPAPPADDALPVLSGFPSTKKNPEAPCTCGDPKGMSGWCERHGIGYVGSVKIRSWLLYEMMDAHGHTLGSPSLQYPECENAFDANVFCEARKIGFVGQKAYFSRLTYELARAEKRDLSKITCSVCRKNARDHGWCERHRVGMVGVLAIVGRERWDHVAKATRILETAEKTSERCEYCAIAIVTDSRCPLHRITYKDGRPVP